jgi:hypothetical protein
MAIIADWELCHGTDLRMCPLDGPGMKKIWSITGLFGELNNRYPTLPNRNMEKFISPKCWT